ncbi:MAG: dUTP diphosphatase [Candidatus Nanoarchaeia archaeon]|nr:dUTP diphosphatase [Candidatus Nanoarchaeia archaeon]
MKINIKKLDEKAIIPKYSKLDDAGLDLTAVSKTIIENEGGKFIEYGTGLAIQIPKDHVGLIFPRSSLSNFNLMLTNKVGVIDSGYRGEIKLRFKQIRKEDSLKEYEIGDRVGQIIIIPYPKIEFEEVNELEETSRGAGGFGSTGS